MVGLLSDDELKSSVAKSSPLLSDTELRREQSSPASAFVASGAATGAGLIPDVVGAVTSPLSEAADKALGTENILPFGGPIGGRESIEFLFNKLGVGTTTPGEKPQTLGQSMARATGETVGGLLTFGLAAKAAQAAGKTFGRPLLERTGGALLEGVVARPATTTAVELSAAQGAGAGGFLAREMFPDSVIAEVLGELGGGLGIVGGPILTMRALAATPVIGTAARAARAAFVPFTESGARVRAERRVQDAAQDPQAAARALDDPTISGLSPATQTGEPRLMSLEQSVLDADAQLEGKFSEQTAESVARLRENLGTLGEGGEISTTRQQIEDRREGITTRLEERGERGAAQIQEEAETAISGLEQRKNRLLAALDARIRVTGDLAERRLAEVRPEMRESASSSIVRDEIEKSFAAARGQERDLWNAVPETIKVSTENSKASYQQIWDSLPQAQKDAMPEKAKEFLRPPKTDKEGKVVDRGGKFGKQTTVKELQGLRSELLDEARRAKAAGEFNKARLIEGNDETPGLAEAILDDMASGAGDEINAAREFSSIVAQKFKRGTIGRVLGFSRRGGVVTPPALTLDTLLKPGVRGEEAFQAIATSVEDNPGVAVQGIQDFLRSRFAARAVDQNGRVVPSQANRFVRDFDEVLQSFPDLRQSLLNAREAQVIADSVEKTAVGRERRIGVIAKDEARQLQRLADSASRGVVRESTARIKRLRNPSISVTADFLNAPVDREIAKIIAAKNPTRAAQEIKRQAAKDVSGDALRGLKAGTVDFIINQAGTKTFTLDGQEFLSGRALRRVLNDKRSMRAVGEILSDSDLTRLDRIANELAKLELRATRGAGAGGVMHDLPSNILAFAGRTMAARAGAKAGAGTSGASLLTAGFASKRMKLFLERITNDKASELIKDAIQDPKLFKSLLTGTTAPDAARKRAFDNLDAWLAGPGSRLLEEDTEQQ